MTSKSPNKSSSRAGRFKKKLVSESALLEEAEVIPAKLAPFLDLFSKKQMTSAELTAVYIIIYLAHRFPGNWVGSLRPSFNIQHQLNFPLAGLKEAGLIFEANIAKRLSGRQTLGDIFQYFALKSTPQAVNRSLLSWSSGSYQLELMFRIPLPREVLDQQKHSRRCVSLLWEKEKISKFILGERDALSFTMHDLIHADHFFHNNFSYQGQLGFYGLLDHCMEQGHFREHLNNDKFESEFEYLISDMNAYAIHLLKCLKSALIYYHAEGDVFFNHWVTKITSEAPIQEALLGLNDKNYDSRQDQLILDFLDRWRRC
jgi:hypothetical protein